MKWNQGRLEIERMLEHRELRTAPPDPGRARTLIDQAHEHLAEVTGADDPLAAYRLDYAAAATAFRAVLLNQGLAVADPANEVVLYAVVKAQLAPPLGQVVKPFSVMRHRLEEHKHAPGAAPPITGDDVRVSHQHVQVIVDVSGRVLDQMDPF